MGPKHIPSYISWGKSGSGILFLIALAAGLFLLTACGRPDGTTAVSPDALPARIDTPTTTAPPTPTVVPLPIRKSTEVDVIRAQRLMRQSFDFYTGANAIAIEEAGNLGVQESIIPLIELSRFVFEDHTVNLLGEALQKLTGESIGGSEWDKWYQWLGDHPELEPLNGYTDWKGNIYSQIDERFTSFFLESADKRIPLWAVQWGGVARDGIPPLENPTVIRGDEAGYLEPDDPIFGAVVNGEARAYPWRQMASHELANDVIQGKPVTVVF